MNRSPQPQAAVPAELAWLAALREPQQALAWPLPEWQRVIRLARRLRLLGRLAVALQRQGLVAQLPLPVQRHLQAEARYAQARQRVVGWGQALAAQALAAAPYPRVLLKGCGYLAQRLPLGEGRMPSDIDLMVPRQHLEDARARLLAEGWLPMPMDPQDERYYELLTHEVAPLVHPLAPVELDLHHNILPPVADVRVDAALLWPAVRASAEPGWQVLAPEDQVLHSAAHLVQDNDLTDRLRDLVDLDALLRGWGGAEPAFWDRLVARALALGLVMPLATVLPILRDWLHTPVPAAAWQRLMAARPALQPAWLLDALLRSVLWPTPPDQEPGARKALAARALLVRHHWQRLPLHELLPHLWRKWRQRPETVSPEQPVPDPVRPLAALPSTDSATDPVAVAAAAPAAPPR